MQEKQDFLMMQIEQLGRALGKILADLLGLKSSGNVSDAFEILSESLILELDIDFKKLIFLSDSEFKDYISDCLFKSSKLYAKLAELFIEAAKMQNDGIKSFKLSEKALLLLKMEIQETKTFSSFNHSRIRELELLVDKYKKTL